ncbi:hypothetical protein [Tetragenococcus halophilus]|uniref:Antitoxin SocA-like Panacea domain-containing protein n=1 Tax=Tetragenococcus halophilus (strain DSM 20338 / JCM 20259 / NCIMB 9735 / NBRC 12172) TaxID=945021 RepID=A0AAN1VRI6_TETHN|nr:hypothetical protein [Tetragenococcus halophilus]BAK95118.1 hypothetical protein TEH_17910 [Tetragenococcus halophilus NBRC 12172]GBD71138.1 putative uncharacterized protein [Tetragenococcus halophilus subsp. halophilus]
MINTGVRRQGIVNWLKQNDPSEYWTSLKVQKFLFFYEVFSKTEGQTYNFDMMKAYVNGPVFSEVYGDYTYRNEEFNKKITEAPMKYIDEKIAIKAHFLINIMNKKDLSKLTHGFDMWNIHKPEIEKEEQQIKMDESDFSEEDGKLAEELFSMYDEEFIEKSTVVPVNDKKFIFSKSEFDQLNEQHRIALETISHDNNLINPVFVEIGEKGELLID